MENSLKAKLTLTHLKEFSNILRDGDSVRFRIYKLLLSARAEPPGRLSSPRP